MANMLIMDT